jgi:DNA-binding PadR family transcriptional regulator
MLEQPPDLTNIELAILGLVAEEPRHAYQIDRLIVERGMRDWTEIGFSSIYYILNRLETAGWLESTLQPDSGRSAARKGPARKVYRLTPAGWGPYREAVRRRISAPRPRSADFLLALANLPVVPLPEVIAALEQQRAALRVRRAGVQAKLAHDRAGVDRLPPHVEALFDYSQALMSAELDWLDHYQHQLENHNERNDEKA